MNRLKFLVAAFTVAVVTLGIYSCTKEKQIEIPDADILSSSFTPQCDFSKSIDTTLHFKIAMMTKIISIDSTFNTKIQQLRILQNPTEAKFYKILNFDGLRLTNEEGTFLNSLNSLEAESFYKEVEEQFNCLNHNSPFALELRVSLWRTLWRIGSAAGGIAVGCATGAGCILAGLYAVDQLSDVFCDFHPERC